ncbi:MAG: hypothetical protein H8E44_38815 [Planctomycetes bacterium]|nr:hypothetical protein [Planctomycetota bacterium]MBL7038881.1 hypothetical protein [Pirellulaceae bacterium]
MRSKTESGRTWAAVTTLAAVFCIWRVGACQAGESQDNLSPHVKLQSVSLTDVRWTEGFWKQKFDVVKDVTIPQMWTYMNGEGNSHWTNFLLAAGAALSC